MQNQQPERAVGGKTSINIVGGYATGREGAFLSRKCINFYPVIIPQQEDNKYSSILYTTSGYGAPFCTLPGSEVKAMASFATPGAGELGFALTDTGFYKITPNGTITTIATVGGTIVAGSSSRSQIIPGDNTYLLIIDCSNNGYTYQISTNTFAKITDANFNGGEQGFFQDGYWCVVKAGIWNYSALGNPNTWTNAAGLNIIQPNYKPGQLRALITLGEQIYVMCDDHCEVFHDDGTNPFSRVDFSSIHYGIAAPQTAVILDSHLLWLTKGLNGDVFVCEVGKNGWTQLSSGLLPSSGESVSYQINKMPAVSDAFAFGYSENGHYFYQITFPTADKTFVYEATSKMWHEKTSQSIFKDANGRARIGRHRANCFMSLGGKNIIGDYESGNLYVLDPTQYSENGTTIQRVLESKTFQQDRKYLVAESLTIDYNSGEVSPGVQYYLTFKVSKDSARSFSPSRLIPLGKVGQTTNRVKINKLGRSRDWTFRFEYHEQQPIVLAQAVVDVHLMEY